MGPREPGFRAIAYPESVPISAYCKPRQGPSSGAAAVQGQRPSAKQKTSIKRPSSQKSPESTADRDSGTKREKKGNKHPAPKGRLPRGGHTGQKTSHQRCVGAGGRDRPRTNALRSARRKPALRNLVGPAITCRASPARASWLPQPFERWGSV